MGREGLLLVGYRVVPPWIVPDWAARDPMLPARVVTISDHLVDPVPDEDTWFASPEAALAAARSAGDVTRVLAMGVHERDADAVIRNRVTVDTDQLCLNEHTRTPWPAHLRPLGYELLGLESCAFHSWLCYGETASWAHGHLGIRLNAHGLVDALTEGQRLGDAAEEMDSGLPPIPWIPAALAVVG